MYTCSHNPHQKHVNEKMTGKESVVRESIDDELSQLITENN
jgi:hypothetical protein